MSRKRNNKKLSPEKQSIAWILLFSVLIIILWHIPYGNIFLYPFTILGTWFHEMGHGIMALILGANFESLEIYSNGSGLAIWSGNPALGNVGKAIVAMAGPLGPTLAGAVFLILSKKEKYVKSSLITFAIVLLISVIFWLRSVYGVPVILFFSTVILIIGLKASLKTQKLLLIFIGIQSFLSIYQSIGYLMSQEAYIDDNFYISDTGVISQNLFFPYWIWGTLIIFISIFVFISCLQYVYKR